MNQLTFLFGVLLFGGAFSAIYFALIRPALIFWLRRTAVGIRDDLQLAVKTGEIGAHEKAVGPTVAKLAALISGCEHIGMATVALAMHNDSLINFEAERNAQTNKDAGSEMKEIIRRADVLVVATIVLNSPFFWFVLPPLFILGALTGKISRWINSVAIAVKENSGNDHHGGLAPV